MLKNFLISIIFKFWTAFSISTLQNSNIDEEVESSLLVNNQIHSHNTRSNNHINIFRVNRSKTKYCVLHNGMIKWNSLPDVFKVNLSFSTFKSKVRNFYLKKYLEIFMLTATMITFLFLTCVHLLLFKCRPNCFRFWIVNWKILNCFFCCYNHDCYCGWFCSCKWDYYYYNTVSM